MLIPAYFSSFQLIYFSLFQAEGIVPVIGFSGQPSDRVESLDRGVVQDRETAAGGNADIFDAPVAGKLDEQRDRSFKPEPPGLFGVENVFGQLLPDGFHWHWMSWMRGA